MPFWWRRRRKRWFGRRNFRWRRQKYKRRPRKAYRRRRYRSAPRRRRRRRRRYKVKKKKQTIVMRQWQPDSIKRCKIKGVGTLVLGANGRQFVCWTNVKTQLTPPKAPCGGGFGYEQYSLGFLYEQYTFRNNIWTASNINKDLCRYLRARFTMYRHQTQDFIIAYERQPPFLANEYTYMQCHPQMLLLSRHKKILLSKMTNPRGKLKTTFTVKPPKQMISKWFFQKQFSTAPLLAIKAAACNFNYVHLGNVNNNLILTFSYINLGFYQLGNWAFHPSGTSIYLPYNGVPNKLFFWNSHQNFTESISEQEFVKKYGVIWDKSKITNYEASINKDTGWFQPGILKAVLVTREANTKSWVANLPVNTVRYNPTIDKGPGNEIWLHSTLTAAYTKPKTDSILIMQDQPLWLGLYGWLSWVQMVKKDQFFFASYVLVIKSKALYITGQSGATEEIIPIDSDYIKGKWPFDEPVTQYEHNHWYPSIYHQLNIINAIVCCGPYVPKIDYSERLSNWELNYHYQFFFKWGGPQVDDQQAYDPQIQTTYDVPDKIQGTIQIRDPRKQSYETLLHPWDYRRGDIKKSALKRMFDHLSIDTSFQPDAEPIQKKKKVVGPELTVPQQENQEIQSCLLSLCEENIFQETEETNLLKLIQQQQQQQQELKYNLLKILSEMKEQQVNLQLQTGILN
nr:MAG: ORF1 [Torque teno midi virus]